MKTLLSLLLLCCSIIISWQALAHQPVMDMAPRWQDGYGFQIRQQHRWSNQLLNASDKVANPNGLSSSINTTWFEGVYTFKREVRLTLKIPYHQYKITSLQQGKLRHHSGRGLGDIIIGLPLKSYTNDQSATSNIAMTPSIRLPTGASGNNNHTGDGSTDYGISFSASFEQADLYQYYDFFYWKNGAGNQGAHEGNELGFDLNVGWHPYHDNAFNQGLFVMWDISARDQRRGTSLTGISGGRRISTGPVIVGYRAGIMWRAEYKYPIYQHVIGSQLSYGKEFSLSIGFVF